MATETRPRVTARPADVRRERRHKKRADGEGTLYFDAKAKLWRASVMVGWKAVARPGGTLAQVPDRRKVAARSQEECLKRLHDLRADRKAGVLAEKPGSDTVASFLERWLGAKAGAVRDRTHARYCQLLRKHVVPALGRRRLPALRPDALQRLYAEKAAAGLALRTVHHVHCVLHNALEDAVRWGYVGRNVAAVVEPPAVPAPELRWPTAEEVGRLLATAARHGDRLHALWAVAAHTGMRQGELLGLTWDDVDLDAGVLAVRRVLVRVKARVPTFGEPKTRRGRRPVPLAPAAAAALRAHRARQHAERLLVGAEYGPHDLVFATQVGTPLAQHVVHDGFKRALGRAGLPRAIRFHDLRHAAATLMLGSGVDVPTVARVLGHARNSTTLDVYGHAVPDNLTAAVAVLQRAIHGPLPHRLPHLTLGATRTAPAGEPGGSRSVSGAGAEGEGFEPSIPLPV